MGILLAVFLIEESRVHLKHLPRRDVFKQYKRLIVACFIIFGGTDLAVFINQMVLFYSPISSDRSYFVDLILSLQLIVIFPGHIILALFYFLAVSIHHIIGIFMKSPRFLSFLTNSNSRQAYMLRDSLMIFLSSTFRRDAEFTALPLKAFIAYRRIGRMAFWLTTSGVCSLISGIIFLSLEITAVSPPRDKPSVIFALFTTSTYFRIGMSFSQVSEFRAVW
jgi:hypothetical protein